MTSQSIESEIQESMAPVKQPFLCGVYTFFLRHITALYYLNPSPLTWQNAQQFCSIHCNSSLATVSDQADYDEIDHLISIQNDSLYTPIFDGIWIGNDECIQFDINSNIYSDSCNQVKPFLCQNCSWNRLTKYVISQQLYNYTDGQQFCAATYNTKVADLSNDDSEAQLLCDLHSSQADGCWVSMDYAAVDGSVIDNSNCAELVSDFVNNSDFRSFNDTDCSAQLPVICNARNEFCDSSEWREANGDWTWNEDECTVSSPHYEDLANLFKGTSIKLDRFAAYEWNAMVVEHTFFIDMLFGSEPRTVIVFNINHGSNIVAGIDFRNNETRSFLLNPSGNSSITQRINDFGDGYQVDMQYVLKVMLSGEGVMSLYVNEKMYLSVDLNDRSNGTKWLPLNYHIEAIKIKNSQIWTHSESLFINGEKMPHIYTAEPSMDPSIDPTTKPTSEPSVVTLSPSSDPTISPTYYPTIDPILEPSDIPTGVPSVNPSVFPTSVPSRSPTKSPTSYPTDYPSLEPTVIPTYAQSQHPSISPLEITAHSPMESPTSHPTNYPSLEPTSHPSLFQRDSGRIEDDTDTFLSADKKGMEITEWIVIAMVAILLIITGLISVRMHSKKLQHRKIEQMVQHHEDLHPAGVSMKDTVEIVLNPVPSHVSK